MSDIELYDFGAAISFYRKQKHMTQEQLAIASGIKRNTIASYESTNGQIPNAVALRSIAKVFGVTCDDMIEAAIFMAKKKE